MVAIDTNSLVLFLIADDKSHYQLALDYQKNHTENFVSKTVLLELERVLRAGYKIHKSQLTLIFSDLIEMAHLFFEYELNIKRAIKLYKIGFDFADVLHVLSSSNCTEFVTFDRKFANLASKIKQYQFDRLCN